MARRKFANIAVFAGFVVVNRQIAGFSQDEIERLTELIFDFKFHKNKAKDKKAFCLL